VTVRVELGEFGSAPIDDPSCYPGLRTEYSYVFCGDHLRALDRIDFDVELAILEAAPLSARRAVLAYGSNACPAQLRRKLEGSHCSPVIPMSRGWAQRLAIGYSDHESRYGAIPATVIVDDDAVTEVFVAWLDAEQFELFDRAERANHERRPFDLAAHALYVADAPMPTDVEVYVTTRGVFSHDGVVPGMKGIDTTYRAGPLLTQAEVKALRATA
jgi:hypothetical protein